MTSVLAPSTAGTKESRTRFAAAAANGVTIEQGKYKLKDEQPGNLQPMEMEYDLSGNYSALAKFINALERDKMFFLLDGITLGEQQGNVRLQLKLETYMRSGAAKS